MTRETNPRVSYDTHPDTTAVLGIDFQIGFGDGWEPVPQARRAVVNFAKAAAAWRAAGGAVMNVHSYYTPERGPVGRMTDFVPDAAAALAEGAPATVFYDGVFDEGDVLVHKNAFSAVISSDLVAQLEARGFDTAVVGGLTTPVCVQTTVDALSMSGVKVIVLEDACASQAIGSLTADQAHDAAIQRMAYLFARVIDTATFIESIREHSPLNVGTAVRG